MMTATHRKNVSECIPRHEPYWESLRTRCQWPPIGIEGLEQAARRQTTRHRASGENWLPTTEHASGLSPFPPVKRMEERTQMPTKGDQGRQTHSSAATLHF